MKTVPTEAELAALAKVDGFHLQIESETLKLAAMHGLSPDKARTMALESLTAKKPTQAELRMAIDARVLVDAERKGVPARMGALSKLGEV